MAEFPGQPTSFIGREAELAEALALVRRSQLVTLIGPGGVGKTRLAIEAAQRLDENEIDSVYFVDLAPLRDPGLLERAVITALGGRPDPGRTSYETIVGLLGATRSLLLIDNCEHLIDSVARLVALIVRDLPRLRVLATSREPLDIRSEARWTVPALSDADGVRLFIERARFVNARFTPTEDLNSKLLELCRGLDGLPLAIELAAARVGQMPIAEILSRLDNRFALLTRSDRMALPRHQSLQAAIGWSHDLLDAEEKAAFAGLSVFVGGFELAAADAVAECTLDVLGRLVDKSMVVAGAGIDGRARYRLLETLRQYAHERMQETGRSTEARRRHFLYFAGLAKEAAGELRGPRQVLWMARLDEELPNIRAALEWGRAEGPDAALTMAVDLIWFWKTRGHQAEGRSWLKGLASIAPSPRPEILAAALTEAGDFASQIGDRVTAALEVDHALELWRRLDDPGGIARTLLSKAWIASRGRAELAGQSPLLEQAVGEARKAGNENLVAECLLLLGRAKGVSGNQDEGRVHLEQAAAITRRTGDIWTLSLVLFQLGHLDYEVGRLEAARAHLAECLELVRTVRDPRNTRFATTSLGLVRLAQYDDAGARRDFEAALTMEGMSIPDSVAIGGLALLAGRRGSFERALKLHGAAWSMPWVGTLLWLVELDMQPWIGSARRDLGWEAAAAAWHAGAAMGTTQALAYALSDADEPPASDGPLTAREKQIASLVARGLRNKEIAAKLLISPRTVDAHVDHIRNKLGHQSRAQVAVWAAEQGLVKS